jgi:HPt (histidine-containing phosphotransfer) domain-containing protein
MHETFSREDLLTILGDEDYDAAAQLHELFELEAQRILAEIGTAVTRGDETAVARAAHKLKSVAGNVGGRATRCLAIAIEDAARLRNHGEVTRLAATLGPELQALGAELAECVSDLRGRASR